MNEKEAIEVIKNINFNYSGCKKCVLDNEIPCIRDGMNCQLIAINTVLQLLEQKDNKINKVIDKLKEDIGIGQKELKTEEWYTKKYAVFANCIEYAKDILKILEE